MSVLTIVVFIFAIIGALDYVLGNKLGLGKEFEKGFMLLGVMALSMIGMIVIAPWLAELVRPTLDFVADKLHLDPSIVPASLFANDMGGAPLAVEVARNAEIGKFNALVVSSMMGCTISFTIPFALGMVKKEQHPSLIYGLLCGIITIPVGCLVAGLICRLPIVALLLDLLPLVLLAGVISLGLLKAPNLCVKIFKVFGFFITALIMVGLMMGCYEFLSGKKLIASLAPLEEGAMICVNASIFLAGAFTFMSIISRLLSRPLKALGRKVGINEDAALGVLSCIVTNAASFGTMEKMDEKGSMINSAFAVSAAFTLGGHMAFTMAFDSSYIVPVIVGKIVSGLCALVVAYFLYPKVGKVGIK